MDEDLFAFSSLDMARIFRMLEAFEGGQFSAQQRTWNLPDRNYAKVWFRNDNAGTAPAYGLLRVTTPTTVDDVPFHTIDKANGTLKQLYLVNGPDDVETTGFGCGTWLWHGGPILYDTGNTPAPGEMWGPKDDSWLVWQHRPGFHIFGATAGSGATARVEAMQVFTNSVFCQADEAIAGSASGAVRVYGGTQGSEADTGLTIASCYNPTTTDIADNDPCVVRWLHGKPYLEPIC